jgi:hypothetical protein
MAGRLVTYDPHFPSLPLGASIIISSQVLLDIGSLF